MDSLLPAIYALLYLLINVAVGLLACLRGKRLFYVLLGLLVFLGVFNVVLAVAEPTPVALVIAAALGLVAALVSKYAYKAGVFLVGFFAGAALTFFLVQLALPADLAGYLGVIVVVGGALVGLLAMNFADAAVRLGTAWCGASYAVPSALAAVLAFERVTSLGTANALTTFESVAAYLGGPFAAAYATPILVGTLALTVVGAAVQARHR